MASALTGKAGPRPTGRRQSSLSSFPNARPPSRNGRSTRDGRSPNPPGPRDHSQAASISSNSTGARPRIGDRSNTSTPQPAAAEPEPITMAPTRARRRLRSQYPAHGAENHVEYILVASFDIDRGSVMEHQYPAPISGDETMLAELMLPDQAHVRSQDWTIFFLHKDVEAEEEVREDRRRRRRERRERKQTGETNGDAVDVDGDAEDTDGSATTEDESTFGDDAEGPPLIYVLNLVNTKQDNNVKRGAVVKAMAICTRHSFLHIYKPILLLALEDYFRAPALETLATLYDAVNSMDLSLMPRLNLLERYILQTSDAKDIFIEKFAQMIQQRMARDAAAAPDNSSSSGSPPALPQYSLPRDTHEFESAVLYNNIRVPIKVPTAVAPEQVGDFSLIKLISTFAAPHASSPQPFALHPHLTTSGAYTHPVMVLVNAILTQKRVIFLGHNRPSGEVAEAVLAACALASGGILRGFTRHAFPYTDLTKIDELLKVPGFIAGVTNPAFAHKAEWWDLLCDLPTGRMKISNRIEGPPVTDGLIHFQQQSQHLPSFLAGGGPNGVPPLPGTSSSSFSKDGGASGDAAGDAAFMDSVLGSIASRHGEAAIRHKFRAWVRKFTRIAAAFEEVVYGTSTLYIGAASTDSDAGGYGVSGHGSVWPDEGARARELAANVSRIEGWRTTRSYYSFVQDLGRVWERTSVVRCLDFSFQLERLRALRMSHDLSAAIYLAIAKAVEEGGGCEADLLAGLVSPPQGSAVAADDASAATTNGGTTLVGGSGDDDADTDGASASAADRDLERRRYTTILQLLTAMPDSNSGVFYVSLGLFHPRADVRAAVVRLLERIRENEAGRHFWTSLGRFAKLAFFRVKRELEAAKAEGK